MKHSSKEVFWMFFLSLGIFDDTIKAILISFCPIRSWRRLAQISIKTRDCRPGSARIVKKSHPTSFSVIYTSYIVCLKQPKCKKQQDFTESVRARQFVGQVQ